MTYNVFSGTLNPTHFTLSQVYHTEHPCYSFAARLPWCSTSRWFVSDSWYLSALYFWWHLLTGTLYVTWTTTCKILQNTVFTAWKESAISTWCVPPSPPLDIIWAMMIVWSIREKIIKSVLCSIVNDSCAQWYAHTICVIIIVWSGTLSQSEAAWHFGLSLIWRNFFLLEMSSNWA